MAKTESVAVQMKEILDEYSQDVKDATNDAIDSTAKESVRKLKNTSPKKSGKYARGWTLKRDRSVNGIKDVTVHNKQYQLTHLLENGHVVRNAYGEYGRAPAHKHIEPVETWASEELVERIEREL